MKKLTWYFTLSKSEPSLGSNFELKHANLDIPFNTKSLSLSKHQSSKRANKKKAPFSHLKATLANHKLKLLALSFNPIIIFKLKERSTKPKTTLW